MATIPTYNASVGLRSPGRPDARLIAPEAQALEQVGASIADAGAAVQAFQDRNDKRDAFKAENDYRKFQLELGAGMAEQELNAPVDGAGFHDGFVENVYRPKRDEFLAKVPPKLRERYETLLGDDDGAVTTEWSIKAAEGERKISATWAKQELATTQQLLANAISADPKAYEAFHQSGIDLIDQTPHLTPTERRVEKQNWDNFAQTAYLNRLLEDDPQLVLRELGANPNKLSPATQFEALSAAVQGVESGGDPTAVSPKGAIGTHQVMPGTAREIAREIGDTNFPAGGDPEQVAQYLMRPGISKRYGDYYLKKMMKQFPNDMEAALIAYNGGPERAKAWLASGRDDASIPAESAAYYKKISARLPGLTAPGASQGSAAVTNGVTFVFNRAGMKAIKGQTIDKLHPDLVDRVSAAFAATGADTVKINSGFRDPEDNKRVGGAKQSQHMHGNAMDIDVSGYSHAQRVELIRALSAKGVTGLGVGANVIHADIGGRRAWGYPSIPKWAQPVIAEHMSGKAVAPRGGGRFSTLPYEKRQQFIAAADQKLSAKLTAEARGTALERVQIKQAMNNELAIIADTGQPSGRFDETQVATVLGEDDYVTYADKRAEAVKTFTAKQDIVTMSPAEMEERINDYKADPSSETFASDQKVEAAVVKEIERVNKLRSSQPDKAALEFPEVKAMAAKVQQDVNTDKANPADMQAFVALMLEKQKEFGIPEKALAPVPREWAFEIGQSLTRVPERKGQNADEVRAAIAVQYNALHQYFGDFTDEVIMYALTEYKGLPKGTAEQVTNLMERVARGVEDPFKLKVTDAGEVEQMAEPGIFDLDYWYKRTDQAPEDEEMEEQLDTATAKPATPELILRATSALDGIDISDPTEVQALVDQYGRAAVDAAIFKREQGATE